ncbi:MAG: hypothetical protein ACOX3A_08055 [bacterium]
MLKTKINVATTTPINKASCFPASLRSFFPPKHENPLNQGVSFGSGGGI